MGEEHTAAPDCRPTLLFRIVWDELNDIMGSAATATLMRRAAKRAAVRSPELAALAITREHFEYRYALPESWNSDPRNGLISLRGLTRDLQPLLAELTGTVVLQRLRNFPQLTCCGLFHSEVDQ